MVIKINAISEKIIKPRYKILSNVEVILEWTVEMMVMAIGETCRNNEGGYHKVVSQTEIEFVNKKLNIFRTTRCTSSAKYI
jgi:hypothetical protein